MPLHSPGLSGRDNVIETGGDEGVTRGPVASRCCPGGGDRDERGENASEDGSAHIVCWGEDVVMRIYGGGIS